MSCDVLPTELDVPDFTRRADRRNRVGSMFARKHFKQTEIILRLTVRARP